jgi:cytochrome c peroxidase
VPLNIGISDASRRTPDLPLFTLECPATGQVVQTTDPGRALITGKCVDIGKVKGPILRGLSARAPYFHNGAAATLRDVVEFYNTRFQLQLTPQDMDDVVAFLQAL